MRPTTSENAAHSLRHCANTLLAYRDHAGQRQRKLIDAAVVRLVEIRASFVKAKPR